MSASNKKKLRKEQNLAAMTEKQKKERKEAGVAVALRYRRAVFGGRRVAFHGRRLVSRCAQLLSGHREESVKRPPTRARINNKV